MSYQFLRTVSGFVLTLQALIYDKDLGVLTKPDPLRP